MARYLSNPQLEQAPMTFSPRLRAPVPTGDRAALRQQFWRRKHEIPEWAEDIHFALFPGDGPPTSAAFFRGVELNTANLAQTLLDQLPVYSLSRGARFLDFACGAGDLLLSLAEYSRSSSALGIDIAEPAVGRAQQRVAARVRRGAITDGQLDFREGGLDTLVELANSTPAAFDVVVCRDAYYLFDTNEQDVLLEAFRRLLRPGGIACIADLAVRADVARSLGPLLLERQAGGDPIRWTTMGHGRRSFSIERQLADHGLVEIQAPVIDERAVALSYTAAAALATEPATASSYRALAQACQDGRAEYAVVYAAWLYTAGSSSVRTSEQEFGVELGEDLSFKTRPRLLRAGAYTVPFGKRTLVLGRSGVGKSTFLRMLAGLGLPKGAVGVGRYPRSSFLLVQRPDLISQLTVEENIALFARDLSALDDAMNVMGFDKAMRRRKANESLSGGEQQRVALGQAMAAAPELLLLDEPCAGVDRLRKERFFATLFSRRNRDSAQTVVCVDHDFIAIERHFDCVFEIVHGMLMRHVKT